jgi:hypothetical protein
VGNHFPSGTHIGIKTIPATHVAQRGSGLYEQGDVLHQTIGIYGMPFLKNRQGLCGLPHGEKKDCCYLPAGL